MPDPKRLAVLTRLAAAAVDRLEGVPAEAIADPNRSPYLEIVPADIVELCDLAQPANDDDAKLVAELRLGSAAAPRDRAFVRAAQVIRLAALAGIEPPARTPPAANPAAKAASKGPSVAADVAPGK